MKAVVILGIFELHIPIDCAVPEPPTDSDMLIKISPRSHYQYGLHLPENISLTITECPTLREKSRNIFFDKLCLD